MVKKPNRSISFILVPITLFIIAAFGCSDRLPCEQVLSSCQNTLKEITKTTYFPSHSKPDDFVRWWKSAWFPGRPLGLISANYQLQDLAPYSTSDGHETYILPGDTGISVTIEIPVEKPKSEEEYPPPCFQNKAKLRASGDSSGFTIDLNPYCSENYSADEVDISLYWISLKEKPIVEIVTNGPACVPATLYVYKKSKQTYEVAAEKCGG